MFAMQNNATEPEGMFRRYLETYKDGYSRGGLCLGFRNTASDVYWDIYWPLHEAALYVGDFFVHGYRQAKLEKEDEKVRAFSDTFASQRPDIHGEVARARLAKRMKQAVRKHDD